MNKPKCKARCLYCSRERTLHQTDSVRNLMNRVYLCNIGRNAIDGANFNYKQILGMISKSELVDWVRQCLCPDHEHLLGVALEDYLIDWNISYKLYHNSTPPQVPGGLGKSVAYDELSDPSGLDPMVTADSKSTPRAPVPAFAPCFHQSRRRSTRAEDCIICYDSLSSGKLVWCKGNCGINLHAACWAMHKDAFLKARYSGERDISDEIVCLICRKPWLNWRRCKCDEDLDWRTGDFPGLYEQIKDSFFRWCMELIAPRAACICVSTLVMVICVLWIAFLGVRDDKQFELMGQRTGLGARSRGHPELYGMRSDSMYGLRSFRDDRRTRLEAPSICCSTVYDLSGDSTYSFRCHRA